MSSAVNQVVRATIDFGAAADTITDAAAHVLGVNRTDMRLIALIRSHRQIHPGRLASLASLSSGAATTAVQRLVAAGYVQQADDPQDGRRVVVTLTPLALQALAEIYGPMIERGQEYIARLSPEQLTTLQDFMQFVATMQREHAALLAVRPSGEWQSRADRN